MTRLPLGQVSTSARAGYLWSCQLNFTGGGAKAPGPWIDLSAGTWDRTKKITVDGSVSWTSSVRVTVSGSTRTITSNGLPSHRTGVYPVQQSDDAAQYDPNPHSITTQSLSFQLTADPTPLSSPTCAGGVVAIMLTGAVMNNGYDAAGRDAVAYEIQDTCGGHPQEKGQYHYHGPATCASDPGSGHSALLGYVLDGFGLYGFRGEDGRTLTNNDLDECHGHAHTIDWDGVRKVMYHYHFTWEFPYTVGCHRARAVRTGP
jgi:hypothetical protein